MGFNILNCAASIGDIGKLILVLKIVYYSCDLSDMAIFPFFQCTKQIRNDNKQKYSQKCLTNIIVVVILPTYK